MPKHFPLLPQQALTRLGERIALARRARELTQKQVAELSDIGLSSIVALEQGAPGVAIGTLVRVLDSLQLLEQLDSFLKSTDDELLVAQAIRRLPKRSS